MKFSKLLVPIAIVYGSALIAAAIRELTFHVDRHALVSNFSRFGEFKEYNMVIHENGHIGYFVRDDALWEVQVVSGEPIKSTAKVVDVFTTDPAKMREVLAAVDAINTDAQDDPDADI
jgi:hypothetical protein